MVYITYSQSFRYACEETSICAAVGGLSKALFKPLPLDCTRAPTLGVEREGGLGGGREGGESVGAEREGSGGDTGSLQR